MALFLFFGIQGICEGVRGKSVESIVNLYIISLELSLECFMKELNRHKGKRVERKHIEFLKYY